MCTQNTITLMIIIVVSILIFKKHHQKNQGTHTPPVKVPTNKQPIIGKSINIIPKGFQLKNQ
jgi:hypothetical protein